MKAAAGAVAVLAWGGLLGALWYALVAPVRPPMALWLAVVVASFLIGLVVPAFLISLEDRMRLAATAKARAQVGLDERAAQAAEARAARSRAKSERGPEK